MFNFWQNMDFVYEWSGGIERTSRCRHSEMKDEGNRRKVVKNMKLSFEYK